MATDELSQDDIDALLNRAAERARAAAGPGTAPVTEPSPAVPEPALQAEATNPQVAVSTGGATGMLDDLLDIPLELRVRLGEAVMPIEDVIALREGSVVELDRSTGDPVDILASNRVIAKGEVVVVDDRFTVRLTQILAPQARREKE